ncbi:MAG: formamidopyrimidine-DNA glycosylase [Bellilinea sp.]|nr:MAG: formamidopyrimidine-DNA glycosylase [Bellilinea sp.]
MPELPEVETIVRALQHGGRGSPPLVGRVIEKADLLWQRSLAAPQPHGFLQKVRHQPITHIGRRGKFILIHLGDSVLLIHLRMSGDLRLEPVTDETGSPIPPLVHDRIVFHLTDGWRMAFNDPRKFGRIWLVDDPHTVLDGLGPEPLDERLTAEVFYYRLSRFKRQLKPLLLDQSLLAGLGNIYTDEALHLARLHPLTPSNLLNLEEAARLLEAIRTVLQEGIRRNGASIDWVYRGGSFQNHFRAYGRTGQPCPECGTPIARLIIGQRSTHFCPACQPLKVAPAGGNPSTS